MEVNIWSHLLGAIAFGLLAGYASFTYLRHYPTSSYADTAVFACFFGGAVMCLGLSASVHPLEFFVLIEVSHHYCALSVCVKVVG
jgi:adiponectin receptor